MEFGSIRAGAIKRPLTNVVRGRSLITCGVALVLTLGGVVGLSTFAQAASKAKPKTITSCSQINLKKRKAPANPPTIDLAGSLSGDSYAQLIAMNGISPASVRPYENKFYKFEVTTFPTASSRYQALEAGQVNAVLGNHPSDWIAYTSGVQMQEVASAGFELPGSPNDIPFLVSGTSKITGYAGFAGQTIAYTGPGSGEQVAIDAALLSAGESPTDWTPVLVLPPATTAALNEGQVGVTYSIQPYTSEALFADNDNEVGTSVGAINAAGGGDGLEALDIDMSPSFIQSNKVAVCAFLSDYASSTKWLNSNIEQYRAAALAAGDVTGISLAQYQALPYNSESFPTAGVAVSNDEKFAALAIKVGVITQAQVPNFSKFVSSFALKYVPPAS